jgi:hypothetical protein
MREPLNIQRLLRINPEINRRNAAGEQIKHHIQASHLQPSDRSRQSVRCPIIFASPER